jgi:hypothetical protein
MAREMQLTRTALVLLFSGAMVALGLNEIHQKVVREPRSRRVEILNMVEQLHGVTKFEKDAYRPAAVNGVAAAAVSSAKKSPEDQERSIWDILRGLLP